MIARLKSFRGRVSFLTAFTAIVALSPAMPSAAARDLITTANYSLTFPGDWMTLDATDSGFIVLNSALPASCVGTGENSPGMDLDAYVAGIQAEYADEYIKVASENKVLGSNTFKMSEWKSEDSTSEDAPGNYRFYATSKGSYHFISWMAIPESGRAKAIADIESALTTLRFTTSGAIRPITRSGWNHAKQNQHDLLGRNWAGTASHSPVMPLFRKSR